MQLWYGTPLIMLKLTFLGASAGVPNLILTHFSPRHHGQAEQRQLMQEVRAA